MSGEKQQQESEKELADDREPNTNAVREPNTREPNTREPNTREPNTRTSAD